MLRYERSAEFLIGPGKCCCSSAGLSSPCVHRRRITFNSPGVKRGMAIPPVVLDMQTLLHVRRSAQGQPADYSALGPSCMWAVSDGCPLLGVCLVWCALLKNLGGGDGH